MNNTNKYTAGLKFFLYLLSFLILPTASMYAQAELMPWGNLTGIRIKGQLMEFATSLNVMNRFSDVKSTGKERQQPLFKREANTQIVTTTVAGIQFTETVKDSGQGSAVITIKYEAVQNMDATGIYLGVRLPNSIYQNSPPVFKNKQSAEVISPEPGFKQTLANKVSYISKKQKFSIVAKDTLSILVQDNKAQKDYLQIYLPLSIGSLRKGQTAEKSFVVSVSGITDQTAAEIQLNDAVKGRPFAGLGGNFRLQRSKAAQQTDQQVIDYCLKNLRVAWGRVEMPWRQWHTNLEIDPTTAADSGKMEDYVLKSMLMAQRLGKMNMPVIVSAWFPPGWAVEGPMNDKPDANGIWGNPLNKSMMPEIYKSIADYLIYLKTHYGTETAYFSFNESDLGINVRQTAGEHADLIKGLGAYFVSRGLKTKLLLGDNSDANSYTFIYPALNDPEARQYIGAISFHSWRGWDQETLQKWADAASMIHAELIVGEGSIDAAAWRYPNYFQEEAYALEEINLYTRLLAICQPASILQWELTSDYSLLKGGGVFGDNSPLAPTRRFWQLKQLGATKANLLHINAVSSRADISCAALVGENSCTIHIVNNSAGRKIVLKGIPKGINSFTVTLTDKTHNMNKMNIVPVIKGEAIVQLAPRSYVTLHN